MLRAGLIGFGAIGRQVAAGIATGRGGEVQLGAILTRSSHSFEPPDVRRGRASRGLSSESLAPTLGKHRSGVPSEALSSESSEGASGEVRSVAPTPAGEPLPVAPMVTDLAAFLAHQPEVVLEAASADAVVAYAAPILQSGASLIVASSTALVDAAVRSRLEAACRVTGARVYVPAGALAGLDALTAAAGGSVDAAALRVVEPGAEPRQVFHGSALEAAGALPDRLNIAATAALAVGLDAEMTVSLEQAVADVRTIELSARGAFGEFSARIQPRPRADQLSHIVALSLLAALRRLQQSLWIG
jgi:aspartate dehydrogenase